MRGIEKIQATRNLGQPESARRRKSDWGENFAGSSHVARSQMH